MLSFDVNWLAILVCAVANMIVGMLWYGPLFMQPWLDGIGKTEAEIRENNDPLGYVWAIANSLVMAFVLANVLRWTGASSVTDGLMTAGVMWLGFNGLAMGSNHAFEGRKVGLWAINSGMYLVGGLVMSVILTLWP